MALQEMGGTPRAYTIDQAIQEAEQRMNQPLPLTSQDTAGIYPVDNVIAGATRRMAAAEMSSDTTKGLVAGFTVALPLAITLAASGAYAEAAMLLLIATAGGGAAGKSLHNRQAQA